MAMQPLRLVRFEALYEVLINEICGIMKINFKGDGSRRLASLEVFRFDELKIYAADAKGFFMCTPLLCTVIYSTSEKNSLCVRRMRPISH